MGRRRLIVAIALVAGGCRAILGLDDPTIAYVAFDGAVGDAQTISDVDVAGPVIDAGPDADADEPDVLITYNDWNNSTLWNHLDLSQLVAGQSTFTGGVFDGQYIYLAPSNNTLSAAYAARYDTRGGGLAVFTNWKFFDTTKLSPDARGFESAFYDGHYVYFVPYANATDKVGLFVRYDPTLGRGFSDLEAWTTFDTNQMDPNARGFMGGAYDGQKYAYIATGISTLPPDPGRPKALAARFDTTQPFQDAGSWTLFDTKTIDLTLDAGGPRGFCGAIYANDFLYFVPFGYEHTTRGVAVRYDTKKSFTSPSSWEDFDTQQLSPFADGFQGGAFDGRHIYFSPLLGGVAGAQNSTVVRFDTQQPFQDAGSWNVLDLATLDAGGAVTRGYIGAGFDGRYVYFVPNQSPELHGWIARFDSLKESFDDPTAWSFFNGATIDPNARGFCGSVFDGQTIYFIPCITDTDPPHPTVLSFTAAQPARLPKFMPGGSFL